MGIFLPKTYIEESVDSEFYANGTLISEESSGSVKVNMDQRDVLQDVNLELSSKSWTNLVRNTAYMSAVACPTGDKSKLYVNTTESDRSYNYDINSSITPRINVNISYENRDGGKDIHSGNNTFHFRVELTSTEDMNDAEFIFRVPLNKGPFGEKDAFNLKNQVCSKDQVCRREDTDNDRIYDQVRWKGRLDRGEYSVVEFEGDLNVGENIQNDTLVVKMDEGKYVVTNEKDNTFTDMSFSSRYAKDSARNGIYLSKSNEESANWRVRGFFVNKANQLRYKVEGWELYRVKEESPILSSDKEVYLEPGDSITTDEFVTSHNDKNYFLSSFNWSVVWGRSFYNSITSSSVTFPPFYVIKSWLRGDLAVTENELSGTTIEVTNKVRHLGNQELKSDKARFYSIVPNETEEGNLMEWRVQNASLYYRNSTDSYDVTEEVNITSLNSSSNRRGAVIVDWQNDSSHVGPLEQNEDLILKYEVTGDSSGSDRYFTFSGNSTIWTESGTPDVQSFNKSNKSILVPSVETEEQESSSTSGGAGVQAIFEGRIGIEHIEVQSKVDSGDIIKVEREDRIIDTGNAGARNLNHEILLPKGRSLRESSLVLSYMKGDVWREIKPENYSIDYKGLKEFRGKEYEYYEVKIKENKWEGLTLYNDDRIRIEYKSRVRYGTNDIITRLKGYDYYEDRFFSDDTESKIRIDWETVPMETSFGRWIQMSAIVGEPVRWTKEIQIENPNNVSIRKDFRTNLPKGAISASLLDKKLEVETEEGMPYVVWDVTVPAEEEESLVLNAYTPPILLVKQQETILKSKEKWVTFLRNSTFESFGDVDYEDAYRELKIGEKKIISAESNGKNLSVKGQGNKTRISLGDFYPGQTKEISLVYKEIPPILILTTDSMNYTEKESADISVIAVGREGQTSGYVELSVYGPTPGGNTVYADILSLGGNRSAEFKRTLDLSNLPKGNYAVKADFRKNYEYIITEKTEIWNEVGKKVFILQDSHMLILIGVLSIFIAFRVYKKRKKYREKLEKLRKEVEETFK